MNALTQLTDVFQSAAVASERVFSILDTPSEVADATESEPNRPGFRSARGKVRVPAKVKVNRR